MPADLDQLFDALGRQADAVPLSGAEHAIGRGRRRNRVRAAVSAAAAVVVVLAASADALRPPDHGDTPAVDAPTMREVGPPISLGGRTAHAITATDGTRAYTAWIRYEDNSAWVLAADLGTGSLAWPARPIADPQRSIDRVVVVPSAVLVVTRAHNGVSPALGLYAFDPATGRPLWQMTSEEDDQLVFTDRMLVRLSHATGQTEGYAWTTGARRWTVPPSPGNPPMRVLGMGMPADEEKVGSSGPPATFSDPRFVLVSRSGGEIRDVTTGRLLRVHAEQPLAATTAETMVAYDGWLYTHDDTSDAVEVQATDLAGGGKTELVHVVRRGRFVTLGACGPHRVCLVTQADDARTTVTGLDARERRPLWQATWPGGGDEISSAHGRTLLSAVDGGYQFFDAGGRAQFSSPQVGGWLDPETLLVTASDGTGRLSRWSAATGQVTPLGTPTGGITGVCASTSDRLACPTGDGLRIWQVR